MTVVALNRLLPANQTAFETAEANTSERLLAVDVNAIRRERRPDQCDAAFVPLLGWETSVHFWKSGDEAGNRARIASSFGDHLSYGTPQALEGEIALDTGLHVRIVEFFEDRTMEWPDIKVEVVINPGDPLPDLAPVLQSAIRRKNVRDWPSLRVRGTQPLATDWIGAGVATSPRVKILPEDALPPPPTIFAGATTRALSIVKVRPL